MPLSRLVENISRNVNAVWVLLGSKRFFTIIIVLFITQSLFIATTVDFGVPPDEYHHISFIEYYAQNSISPWFSEQNFFPTGDLTRETGYLYHYVMSFVLRATAFLPQVAQYFVLRCLSIAMSVVALLLLKKTADILKISVSTTNMGLFLVTNMASYLLMSMAINSDIAIILATAVCFYLSAKILTSRIIAPSLPAMLLVAVGLGAVSKRVFLPAGIFFAGIAIYGFVKSGYTPARSWIKDNKILAVILVLAMLTATVLVVERYGINYLSEGRLNLVCDQVHSKEQCLQNGVYRRNATLSELSPPSPENLVSPVAFVLIWAYAMVDNILGIQSWARFIIAPAWLVVVSLSLSLTAALAFVLQKITSMKRKLDAKTIFFISALVHIIVSYIFNYRLYLKHGFFGLALQGRYIFTVMPILLLLLLDAAQTQISNRGEGAKTIAKSVGLAAMLILFLQSGSLLFLTTDTFTYGQPVLFRALTSPPRELPCFDLTDISPATQAGCTYDFRI